MSDQFDVENTNIKQYLVEKGKDIARAATPNLPNPQTPDFDVENTNIKQYLAKKQDSPASTIPSNVSPEVMTPNSTLPIGSQPKPGSTLIERLQDSLNKVGNAAQAFNVGVEAFGTTLAKGASKAAYALLPEDITKNIPSSKSIQSNYDKRYAEYKQNKESNPGLGLVNLAGSVAASSILPGSMAFKAGGKIGNAVGGTLGELTGQAAGGALYGAAVGAANTQPGQEDVINQSGMKSGALMGGLLGPVQGKLSNTIDDVPAYSNTMNKLNSNINDKQLKFAGPTFDATPNYTASNVDNILQKMPGYLGNHPYLDKEAKSFRPYIADMINAVSNKTVGGSEITVTQELTRRAGEAKKLYNSTWEALPKVFEDAGIKKMPDTFKSKLNSLVDDLTSMKDPATTSIASRLSSISKKSDLSLNDVINAKQQLWKDYTYIQKQVTNSASGVSTIQRDTADKLLNGYWGLVDDIGNVAKGTKAEGAFETANGISRAYNSTFDPSVHPLLVNAIDDARGTQALIKEMINPNTKLSKDDIKNYLGVLGPQGSNELESIGLRKAAETSGLPEMIDNSMNVANRSLDLGKFLTQVEKRIGDSAHGQDIYQKSYNALKGLEIVGKNFLQTTKGMPDSIKSQSMIKGAGNMVGMAGGAMAGTYGAGLATAGINPISAAGSAIAAHPLATATIGSIALSTTAMSAYRASGGLKALLGTISAELQSTGVQPALVQYMFQKANSAMGRAGLMMATQPDGTVLIDADKSEQPKKSTPRREALNVTGVRD